MQKENSLQINFDRMDWIARFAGHKYRKPDPGPDFKFSFKIELIEDEIIFTTGKIRNIDDEPCTMEFPFRLLEWGKEEKIDFDLSVLKLNELIETYTNIDEFLTFLKESKVVIDEKEEDDDE